MSKLRRYEDPAIGVSEEFLERRLGSTRSLALLSAPLGERRALGWVISPSIGPEHGNLRRLEALMARSLAAAGFPTLRIRPDLHPTHGAIGEIDVSARIEDLDEAVQALADAAGVQAIGLLGALFGGTVAALAADRLDAPALALVEPVTRGKQYVRETVRRQAIAELMASVEDATDGSDEERVEDSPAHRPLEELEELGRTSIRGLLLSKDEYERISEIDLVQDLRTFRGSALLVGITPSGSLSPGLRKLRDHLQSLGGAVTLELQADPLPAPFGEYFYRNAGPLRLDTRLELDQRLVGVTTAWAVEALAGYPLGAVA